MSAKEIVSWAGPLMEAQKAVRQAGELFESKRTRDGMLEIVKAHRALAEVSNWILTNKA